MGPLHYTDGDNFDILPFNDSGECSSGGLYITQLKDYIMYYSDYGKYARRVRISDTTLVYVEHNKLKCDEIYLEKRVLKDDLLKELFTEYLKLDENILMTIVKKNGFALQCIDDEMKTHCIMLEAVKNNAGALQFIKDEMKTREIMLEAVKNDGYALQFIKDCMKTHEIMLEAVKNKGLALQYIKDEMKTPGIMLEAVKNNRTAYQYIKDETMIMTPMLLFEIIKNDKYAQRSLIDEIWSPEMMLEAVKYSSRNEIHQQRDEEDV
jgi:IMP cyclohydrolase